MLSINDRNKKLLYKPEHIGQRLKQRRHLFPYDATLGEMWSEIASAIKDPQKGIILENENNNQHTHVCVFVGDAGKVIAIPIALHQDHIFVYTIKDVEKDESNPNWFIRGYNKVCKTRGLPGLNLVFR